MACQAALVSEQPIGGEDCLHLSVYTHDVKPNTFKPVMVWIHGGAFNIGTNSKDFFSPECLMRSKIVFISINYRLGAFGKLRIELFDGLRANWKSFLLVLEFFYKS